MVIKKNEFQNALCKVTAIGLGLGVISGKLCKDCTYNLICNSEYIYSSIYVVIIPILLILQ